MTSPIIYPYGGSGLAVPAYTIEMLFTQFAQIERDMNVADQFGADAPPNFQPLATVRCRLAWAKSSGMRSPQREYPTPQRLAPITDGEIVFPLGTDITEEDQVANVLDRNGNVYVAGIFNVVAVVSQETHTEVHVYRTHLGA